MNKTMTTEEGNKLIAEFDGKLSEMMGKKLFVSSDGGKSWYGKLYNEDWNSLMSVVEKIEKLCESKQKDFPEDKDLDDPTGWRAWSYRYIDLSTDITYMWKQVVQFIQWYNNSQKQTT
jgi:hypothetical protein